MKQALLEMKRERIIEQMRARLVERQHLLSLTEDFFLKHAQNLEEIFKKHPILLKQASRILNLDEAAIIMRYASTRKEKGLTAEVYHHDDAALSKLPFLLFRA